MSGRGPGQASITVACYLGAGRAGEVGGAADQRGAEETLKSRQLRHAGRIVMERRGIIGLRHEGVPHGRSGGRLTLQARCLSLDRYGEREECRGQDSQGQNQGTPVSQGNWHGTTLWSRDRVWSNCRDPG